MKKLISLFVVIGVVLIVVAGAPWKSNKELAREYSAREWLLEGVIGTVDYDKGQPTTASEVVEIRDPLDSGKTVNLHYHGVKPEWHNQVLAKYKIGASISFDYIDHAEDNLDLSSYLSLRQ